MKKRIGKTLMLFLIGLLLNSCYSLRETSTTAKFERIDKIAIISTYLGIVKSVVPLVDAAVRNEKINSISGELVAMFEKNVDPFRETVAKSFETNFNCEAIYGDKLHAYPGFQELKNLYNFDASLNTDDEFFPEIAHATNDLNPFAFANADIISYFKNPDNYKNTIVTICQKLNLNYVAVTYSYLSFLAEYLRSRVLLNNAVYIFDKSGTCIATNTVMFSKMVAGIPYYEGLVLKPKEPESYQQALDTHSERLDISLKKMAQFFNK